MDNKSLIQKYCKFLSEKFNFQLIKIKEDKYSIIAKYKPPKVGLYFIYEYREKFPVLQFTLLDGDDFIIRLGLYTLKSFYLDEIYHQRILKDMRATLIYVKRTSLL